MSAVNDFGQAILDALKIVGIILLIIIVLSVLASCVRWFTRRFITVKEEERVVIYRRGKFERVAGPGWIFRWPAETVERTLEVKDQPKSFSVDQLFFYGIPVGFTFSFYSRVNPKKAASGNQALLRDMAMFADTERNHQIFLKIRDSFLARVAELETSRPLPQDATIIDRILPILPGTPDCDRLLRNVRTDLERTLPSVAVYLNPVHPLTVTGLIAPIEMIQGFSRGRMIELLRRSYPDLPEDRLAQMAAAIEGLSTIKTTTIDLKGSEHQTVAELRVGDDEDRTKLKVFPPQAQQATGRQQPIDEQQGEAAKGGRQGQGDSTEELSDRDLRYLKRVPRVSKDQRSAA